MDETAVYDARVELVDFLIEVFHDTPSTEFVERLLGDEVVVPRDSINEPLDRGFERLETFIAANENRPVEDVVEELTVEYTRVFVGPRPPILAHETAYREDTEFIGEGLAEVEASYSAAGWNPPEDYGEENDFVAVELAFLRNLIDRQRRGAEEAFGFERVFLEEHLETWVDDFTADLHEETDEDLYRAAADVLEGFVTFEGELVRQMANASG